MAAHEYAFTLTPGTSSRTRSVAVACAAIAAVCVLSSTLVMRELVGAPTARAAAPARATTAAPATTATATTTAPPTMAAAAATTARTWSVESRWWPSPIRPIKLQAPALQAPKVPDSELTFTKGYQLRLAARQATQPATQTAAQPATAPTQVAATPAAETQPVRPATAARKPTTVAHTDMPPVRRINATPADAPTNPFARFETGTRALSYDEQRSERGFAYRTAPSRGLFGTLY